MKRTLAALLLLASTLSIAQRIEIPQPFLPPQAPDVNMPASKFYINPATGTRPHRGSKTLDIGVSCGPISGTARNGQGELPECLGAAPKVINDGTPGGAFRTLCDVSHIAFDDPIVKPRQSGASHPHQFFGNTTTDSRTDPAAFDEIGGSTCAGGIANRTGYWVPIWVYYCPLEEVGCNRTRNGEMLTAYQNNAYYKSQLMTANAVKAVTWWPKGFRMIAGDPNNVTRAGLPFGGRFDCFDGDKYHSTTVTGTYSFDHFPTTTEAKGTNWTPADATAAGIGYVANDVNVNEPCTEINMLIPFPQCAMPGVLYLPTALNDNKSGHVKYLSGGACTDPAYTDVHPTITYNIHTKFAPADRPYLILSSDQPGASGVTLSGSTTTQVNVAATERSVTDVYKGGYLSILGQRRAITAYNATTKTVTLETALAVAPAAGVTYFLRLPGGMSMHADWANGWNQTANFNGWGRTLTDQIIRSCYFNTARYGDPSTTPRNLDCHDDLLGEPSNNAEPINGSTYWRLN